MLTRISRVGFRLGTPIIFPHYFLSNLLPWERSHTSAAVSSNVAPLPPAGTVLMVRGRRGSQLQLHHFPELRPPAEKSNKYPTSLSRRVCWDRPRHQTRPGLRRGGRRLPPSPDAISVQRILEADGSIVDPRPVTSQEDRPQKCGLFLWAFPLTPRTTFGSLPCGLPLAKAVPKGGLARASASSLGRPRF